MMAQMQDSGIVPISHWPGVVIDYSVNAGDAGSAFLDVRLAFDAAAITTDAISLFDVVQAQLDSPTTSIVLNTSLRVQAEPIAAPLLSVWVSQIRDSIRDHGAE